MGDIRLDSAATQRWVRAAKDLHLPDGLLVEICDDEPAVPLDEAFSRPEVFAALSFIANGLSRYAYAKDVVPALVERAPAGARLFEFPSSAYPVLQRSVCRDALAGVLQQGSGPGVASLKTVVSGYLQLVSGAEPGEVIDSAWAAAILSGDYAQAVVNLPADRVYALVESGRCPPAMPHPTLGPSANRPPVAEKGIRFGV